MWNSPSTGNIAAMTGVVTDTTGTATNVVTIARATGMDIADIGTIARAIVATATATITRGQCSSCTSAKMAFFF